MQVLDYLEKQDKEKKNENKQKMNNVSFSNSRRIIQKNNGLQILIKTWLMVRDFKKRITYDNFSK